MVGNWVNQYGAKDVQLGVFVQRNNHIVHTRIYDHAAAKGNQTPALLVISLISFYRL